MAQPERVLVRRPCVAFLRECRDKGLFRHWDFFQLISPPDLGKLRKWVATQYWLDGYEKGVFDITIIAAKKDIVKVWLVECKYGSNGYTDAQKAVVKMAQDTLVQTIKVYSLKEFQDFVLKEVFPH